MIAPFTVKFFEEDFSVNLIHLHESSFRIILRPLSEQTKEKFGMSSLLVEIVFTELVMSHFFTSSAVMCTSDLIHKLETNEPLTNNEIRQLREGLFSCLPTTRVVTAQDKLEKLGSALRKAVLAVEDHLKSRSLTPKDLSDINYMLALKIFDWKQEHFVVYEILGDYDKDGKRFEKNDENNDYGFVLRARTNFLSFNNCTL